MSDEAHSPAVHDAPARSERKGGKRGGKGGKKGSKGEKGEKGGKSGKGGKGGYDGPRRPRRFNEDKEIEKDTRSLEVLREERDALKALIATKEEEAAKLRDAQQERDPAEVKAEVEKYTALIDEQQDVKAKIAGELQVITKAVEGLNEEKGALLDKRKEVVDEKNRIKKERGLSYTEADLNAAIRKIEKEHETRGNLSRKAETTLLRQLKELERIRVLLVDLRKYDVEIDEYDKEIKVYKDKVKEQLDQKDAKKDEQSKVQKIIKEQQTKIDNVKEGNKAELKAIESELNRKRKEESALSDIVNYWDAKKRNEEDWARYEEDEKKYREKEEQRLREEEEYKMRTNEDYRERKERQARIDAERAQVAEEIAELKRQDPWASERQLCENLIGYLEKALGKGTAPEKVAPKVSEKEKMEAAMKKMQERLGGGVMIGKSDAPADDATLNFKVAKRAENAPRVEKASKKPAVEVEKKEKKPEAIVHSIDKFEAFDKMKVDTPMTMVEAAEILEQLRKRKEWILTADSEAKMEDLRTKPVKQETARPEGAREGKGAKGGKGGKGGKGARKGGKKGRD